MLEQRAVSVEVASVEGTNLRMRQDILAIEEPLEIRLGTGARGSRLHRSISVTMRTPGEDRELAAGFLFTEGIVRSPDQIESIEPWGPVSSEGYSRNITKVELVDGIEVDFHRLERHFYTTSSCGVCGKGSLEALQVQTNLTPLVSSTPIEAEVLHKLTHILRDAQSGFHVTGGLHAAGLFSTEGVLVAIREDVGRHNALDKLIGSQWLSGAIFGNRVLVLSGRISFELVQKALVAGIPFIAAVGAPSSLAVELAEEFGMTLAGFVRDQRFNIYCGAERVSGIDVQGRG